jgi:glycerol uptake facilitator-like aquaporin
VKYELTSDPAIKMLIVSGSYCFAIFVGADTNKMSLSPINPAVSAGLVAADIFFGNWKSTFAWPMCVFPYVGSLIGVIVYEFLYKRAVDAVDTNENEGSLSSGDEEEKETFGNY